MPTTPDKEAGMRIEPAWSPPGPLSTSPAATSAPDPVDEPPGVWPQARGLCTGPDMLVAAPPENEKYSQTDLPTISAPASRRRVITGASNSGTKPSSTDAPLVSGTPASA